MTPFCKVVLVGEKRPSESYPKTLVTLGDHLRKRRLDLGLTQDQAAIRLGADRTSVSYWESNYRPANEQHLASIYAFLGYRPDPIPQGFPEKLRYWRQSLGMSQNQLSEALGFNHAAVSAWEIGKKNPSKGSLTRLQAFLQEKLGKEVSLS